VQPTGAGISRLPTTLAYLYFTFRIDPNNIAYPRGGNSRYVVVSYGTRTEGNNTARVEIGRSIPEEKISRPLYLKNVT
jgi:hypothetical protein